MIGFTILPAEIDTGFVPTQTARYEEKTTFIWENAQQIQAQEYKLGQRLLALEGGNILLRLRDAPVIEFYPGVQRCKVRNWELEFSVSQISEAPHLLARKFLELFSLAQANKLSDSEKANWVSILDEVDYAAFSNDRSAPRYLEGRLVRRKPDVTVEWHDGEQQIIPPGVAASLNLIQEGEDFSAFVKWGRGDRIKHIERVTLLSLPELTDDDWLDQLKPH
jgi:hypothetical protein